MILQIAFDRLVLGKFNKMHNWLFLILLLFGSLTIAFQDPVFLKWKVTITQSILGTVLLVSQYVYKKPLIGMLFKNLNIEIPQKVVNRANLAWVGFFSLNMRLSFIKCGKPSVENGGRYDAARCYPTGNNVKIEQQNNSRNFPVIIHKDY